ncbi:MAG: TRAP transporter fused permease subunit [Proteobacteria bacterium]|nr:TRAP transporter fused permease subunit [Pseudomonadota bacterium]MBU1449541.1 TRAP transporter fused permease subunit [Pseudomonadota bacterium]MBU2467430.1 TRAP transporter fused permease subunit [Pseudomonadota bacterium]MBU2518110.1 TRAP transporter fused permease subunit [Pseudomonadota bacterium]
MSETPRENIKPLRVRSSRVVYLVAAVISVLGTLLCINQIFHLKIAGFMPIGNAYYYYILAMYLSLVFLLFPGSKAGNAKVMWYDWVLFVLCMSINLFLAANAYNILTKGWEYAAPILPTAAGGILWLLALEAVRRAGGGSLFWICLGFSVYPLFAGYMPGFLWGNELNLMETMRYHSMGVESIIGIPTRVVGNLLVGFIIFGVALVSTGGGKFFMDFAMSLMGNSRGGAAKVSVISSAFMASLSGSVISNVVTTGSMTIPAMKKTGYSPTWAAAVEACSSTGGSIMPPVMGAAGFLIASFLNVPYAEVMLAAFFPAFLYYFTLLLQVDLHAVAHDMSGIPRDQLPQFGKTVKQGWFFLGTIVMLVFILFYMRTEAWAPFFVMIFLFSCSMLRRSTRLNLRGFVGFLVDSGRLLAQIAGILAGVGLIIGALSCTGVANSFSRELVLYAGGNVALLLVFGALTSFVLGIGMTVTACYVFLAIVLVPALVGVGLNEMGAHLFVLYWGCLSYITPPVALGAITAAAIAGSDPMRTGFLSMRLGSAKYIVPFLFVLNPAMILHGTPGEVIITVISALVGCIILAGSLEGYLYGFGKLPWMYRGLFFCTAFLFLVPHLPTDLAGIGVLIALYFLAKFGPFKLDRSLGSPQNTGQA